MAQETSHDELLTTGAEFRDLRLFGRQPNDQVDPTMWHAVAAEVKSELANSREHGDSDDTLEVENEGAAGKKKNAKGKRKKEGKAKERRKAKVKGGEKTTTKEKARAKKKVVNSGGGEDAEDGDEEPEMEDGDDTNSDEAAPLVPKGPRQTFFRNTRYKSNVKVAPAKDDGLPYFDDG